MRDDGGTLLGDDAEFEDDPAARLGAYFDQPRMRISRAKMSAGCIAM